MTRDLARVTEIVSTLTEQAVLIMVEGTGASVEFDLSSVGELVKIAVEAADALPAKIPPSFVRCRDGMLLIIPLDDGAEVALPFGRGMLARYPELKKAFEDSQGGPDANRPMGMVSLTRKLRR